MTFFEQAYKRELKRLETFKDNTLTSVVANIRNINADKPLELGNMVYFYVEHNGKKVPAYCYKEDYNNGGTFKPIYDELETKEYGWSDFSQCCLIFDAINRKLFNGLSK